MKEYIERGKLIDDILHALLVVPSEDFLLPPEKDILRMIKSEPVSDVQPIVRGHWIGTKEAEEMGDIMKEFTCSVCDCCEWDCTESESFNFCPNCGADMREPPKEE